MGCLNLKRSCDFYFFLSYPQLSYSNRVRRDGSVFFRSQNVGCWNTHDLENTFRLLPQVYYQINLSLHISSLATLSASRYDLIFNGVSR
jgi:hypothetical protein